MWDLALTRCLGNVCKHTVSHFLQRAIPAFPLLGVGSGPECYVLNVPSGFTSGPAACLSVKWASCSSHLHTRTTSLVQWVF